jgi:kynurenine formamidase
MLENKPDMSPEVNEAEKLVSIVGSMKVYDLGQPYFNGMPVHPEDPPFHMWIYRYHENTVKMFTEKAPGLGFADSMEIVITSMHSGTHFDALCHMSRNGLLYGGVKAADIERFDGYVKYGVDEAPIFVRRGVLVDVPSYKGLDILPERYGITPEDLEETLKWEGVELRESDVALIRTGYSRFFEKDPDAYLHKFAGLSVEAVKWLARKKVGLVGIDNLALGVPKPFEHHLILLVDNGIHVMKSLYLEELARDKQYVSLVVVAPLKIKGATGSLIRPIAIAPAPKRSKT